MLRYATVPMPSKSTNETAKPIAIFLPKVHMPMLLLVDGPLHRGLDRFENRGHGHDRSNRVVDMQDFLHMPSRTFGFGVAGTGLARHPHVAVECIECQSQGPGGG